MIRFSIFISMMFFLYCQPVLAAKRIALVIGNASYLEPSFILDNPENDAVDIADTLEQFNGFDDVDLRLNLTKTELTEAIREFGYKLSAQQDHDIVGLFYYAGHAIEVNGFNILIPVDMKRSEGVAYSIDKKIIDDGVKVQEILKEMQDAKNNMNIIILDACRDNPFANKSRGYARPNSLADIQAPKGGYVAYGTTSGKISYDGGGNGRNGMYTGALLKYIKEPGLEVEKVFKKVRVEVLELSSGLQFTEDHSSLIGNFYFIPPEETPLVSVVEETAGEHALNINSNVPGANVFIDNELVGVTPFSTIDIDERTVTVRIERAGYSASEKKMKVRKSRSISVNFHLEPVPTAQLMLKSIPSEAEWYMDDVYIGNTPDKLDNIDFGEYKITVKKQGYGDWEQMVLIDSIGVKKLNVELNSKATAINKTLISERNIPQSSIRFKQSIQDAEYAPAIVFIEPSEFLMGRGNEQVVPKQITTLKPFAVGKYEVTFEQYDYFVKDTNYKAVNDFGLKTNQAPVINVSWEDALAYTQWLSKKTGYKYRLPSEAEWEYIARTNADAKEQDEEEQDQSYSELCKQENFGDKSYQKSKSKHSKYCTDNFEKLAPVGSFEPNSLGLYDVLGNAAEWTGSFYKSSFDGQELLSDDKPGFGKRVVRGGSWSSNPKEISVARRISKAGGQKELNIGFRVVREIEPYQSKSSVD